MTTFIQDDQASLNREAFNRRKEDLILEMADSIRHESMVGKVEYRIIHQVERVIAAFKIAFPGHELPQWLKIMDESLVM
jgi:hypothetical protein